MLLKIVFSSVFVLCAGLAIAGESNQCPNFGVRQLPHLKFRSAAGTEILIARECTYGRNQIRGVLLSGIAPAQLTHQPNHIEFVYNPQAEQFAGFVLGTPSSESGKTELQLKCSANWNDPCYRLTFRMDANDIGQAGILRDVQLDSVLMSTFVFVHRLLWQAPGDFKSTPVDQTPITVSKPI